MAHHTVTRLGALLERVAAGHYPPPDGSVTVLPQPSARDAGVIAFTAHTVIFTDAEPDWVRGQLPSDDLSAPLNPPFLGAICERTRRRVNNIDLLCVSSPLPGPPETALTPLPRPADKQLTPPASEGAPAGNGPLATEDTVTAQHPRLARARCYRDDVRGWQAAGGIIVLGRGVAGRWEVAVEVDPACRGSGFGRSLALAARHLTPGGAPVWAQVAPGNAASVRAFLAAGYTPVGAEALLVRDAGAKFASGTVR